MLTIAFGLQNSSFTLVSMVSRCQHISNTAISVRDTNNFSNLRRQSLTASNGRSSQNVDMPRSSPRYLQADDISVF